MRRRRASAWLPRHRESILTTIPRAITVTPRESILTSITHVIDVDTILTRESGFAEVTRLAPHEEAPQDVNPAPLRGDGSGCGPSIPAWERVMVVARDSRACRSFAGSYPVVTF